MATRGIRHAKCIDYIDKDVFYSIDKRLLEAAAAWRAEQKEST